MQGHLKNLIGKPSGFIEQLPAKIQGRIEYLRQLQDQHSEVEDQFQQELAALRARYQSLYGEHFFAWSALGICSLADCWPGCNKRDSWEPPVEGQGMPARGGGGGGL